MPTATDRPTANNVFQAVSWLARKGWKLIELYGVREDGTCGCDTRPCSKPGKHPVGNAWQLRATSDEETIWSWFEGDPTVVPNVGVLLGLASGIIDVECDGEEAAESLRTWGLEACDTPTFRSGRGLHRLFIAEPGMPDSATVKVDGIEVRLGGGGKASQSVIPPSWHAAGFAREWLPGKSPEECELQPLPEAFKKAVMDADKKRGGSGLAKQARAATAEGEKFKSGEGRHDYLLGEAVAHAMQTKNLESPSDLDRVRNTVLALNDRYCKPPYPEDEVLRTVNGAIQWTKDVRNAGVPDLDPRNPDAARILAAQQTPWERAGLHKNGLLWQPGKWRVTCVNSDPRRYRLTVLSPDGERNVAVNLSTEEWLSPVKVARKILAATGTVNMHDPSPGKWAKTWAGHSERNEQGQWESLRGLSAQLLDREFVTHEDPAPELNRAAAVAGLLHSHLMQPRRPTDSKDIKPNESGSAKWVNADGGLELWFVWATVWKEINESAETPVTNDEKQDLSESLLLGLGVAKFRVIQPGGVRRHRYYRWNDETLVVLAGLAGWGGEE